VLGRRACSLDARLCAHLLHHRFAPVSPPELRRQARGGSYNGGRDGQAHAPGTDMTALSLALRDGSSGASLLQTACLQGPCACTLGAWGAPICAQRALAAELRPALQRALPDLVCSPAVTLACVFVQSD